MQATRAKRFGLFWPGKRRALRAAQEPTTATLRPDRENSKDWDTTQNVFIEGDNLEVLKLLAEAYHGKVKMIYIDPPYNTGKDFVYPDNFKEGLATYLEWTRQAQRRGQEGRTNSETEGRYHSNWLNMMYPRLKLARNLLRRRRHLRLDRRPRGRQPQERHAMRSSARRTSWHTCDLGRT